MTRFIPVRDRILVRPLEAPSTTPGGLILPTGPTNGLIRAEVVEVGEGPALSVRGLPVQPGDVLHVPANSGVLIEVNGEQLKVVPYEHVFLFERDEQ